MTMKRQIAVRVGTIGALIGLLLVAVDTYKVEQHTYHVLGYHAWPDASSAIGIAVFTAAACLIGFITFFLVSLAVLAVLPRGVA